MQETFNSEQLGKALAVLIGYFEGKPFNYTVRKLIVDKCKRKGKVAYNESYYVKSICAKDKEPVGAFNITSEEEPNPNDFLELMKSHQVLPLDIESTIDFEKLFGWRNSYVFFLSNPITLNGNDELCNAFGDSYFSYLHPFLNELINYKKRYGFIDNEAIMTIMCEFINNNQSLVEEKRQAQLSDARAKLGF